MAPRDVDGTKTEEDIQATNAKETKELPPREYKILWHVVLGLGYLQIAAFYGAYLCITAAKWQTSLFAFIYVMINILGVSGGSHRLWSHNAFKANKKLKYLLALMHASAFQEDIFRWTRNHRLHHKYPDDDADPYNPKRGYFYAHIGWLLVARHPRVTEKGRSLDMSDILSDPVVKFQRKYYGLLVTIFAFLLPIYIPVFFWGETLSIAYHANAFRYITGLHFAFSINSVAHHHGFRPYDRKMGAADHKVVNAFTMGEGSHNFHHAFPFDYRSVEMDTFYFNLTTNFIDLMAKIGWAYDLKSASNSMVDARVKRTGNPEERPPKIRNLHKININNNIIK